MGATAVIVIGRNEGERLRRCLNSVIGAGRTVVYVDSDSRDGSPALAQSLGAHAVVLDMSAPFSAARARNAGVERLLEIEPDVELVQFVDGDCELIAGWFEVAQRTMTEQPQVAAVCGRLRERSPGHSIYNRLADLEWDTPVGAVQSCGGIAMMRMSCFAEVGGFDPTVVAGEEPELCQRFRERGWTILRLADEMALHDSAMLLFSHWWKRCVRSGYGAMDVATRFGRRKDGLFITQIRRARAWSLGLPVVVVVVACCVLGIAGSTWGLVAAGMLAMLWPLEAMRLALKIHRRVRSGGDAIAYGVLTVISRWANVLGQYRYLQDRVTGKNLQLIEYKTAQQRIEDEQQLEWHGRPARVRPLGITGEAPVPRPFMSDPDWQADLQRYGARPLLREQSAWAVAIYRFGRRNDRRPPGLHRAVANRVYWLIYRIIETITGISIPKSVQVGPGLRIYHFGNIFIHKDVKIGANCTLRQGVTIGNRRDGGPVPVVEDDVEFGAYAQVLGGVRIGRGARIGAMSVVLTDVPAGATAVAAPARIIPAGAKSEFRADPSSMPAIDASRGE